MILLYIGPGLGVATIVIVLIVLTIVFASIVIILWRPVKRFLTKIKKLISGK